MTYDIAICGAGVGGLTLAIALGRQGYRVVLIEKQRMDLVVHKGELLQPQTLRILQDWAILSTFFEQDARKIEVIECLNAYGNTFGSLDYRCLPPPFNYSLVHYHTEIKKILYEVARNLVEIRQGRVVELSRSSDGRARGLRILKDQQEYELTAQLIVGADGRTSSLRQHMGISVKMSAYPHQMLALDLENVSHLQPRILNFLSPHGIRALYPMPGNKARLYVQIRTGEFNQIKKMPMCNWQNQLLATTPGLHIIAQQLPANFANAQILGNWHFTAPTWTRPGFALLGDAAHVVHPMAGQGMNAAIADAWVLAQSIQEQARGKTLEPAEVDQALQRYEQLRIPQFKRIARLSHTMSTLYTSTVPLVQQLALRSVRTNANNQRLQYVVTYNMSGLGFRPFTWIDRLYQFGLLPDPHSTRISL